MSDVPGRIGRFDPFEDTGDWPFREVVPGPARDMEVSATPVEAEPDPLPAATASRVTLPEELEESDQVGRPEGAEDDVALVPSAAEGEEPGARLEADPDAGLESEPDAVASVPEEAEDEPSVEGTEDGEGQPAAAEGPEPAPAHAQGALLVPEGPEVLAAAPHGFRRNVAVVVARYHPDVTSRLLERAVETLRECHVADDAITVVPVPGAFELPLAALALAKTRRYSCVVALGCVIRGETAHFDLVANEAASGLQLAAIETGIPVSFGVLACETLEQAEARVDRGAEAALAALEMADLFSQVRTHAAAAT